MGDFNARFYVKKINGIAADHQMGRDIDEVKSNIDVLLQFIKANMSPDIDIQVRNWTGILCELESYKPIKVDARWFTVITHAKKRIKSRRNNTLSRKRNSVGYSLRRGYR